MKRKPPVLLSFLALTWLFVCHPSRGAAPGSGGAAPGNEVAAAESAVRQADADWAWAARSVSVDAWMAFYAADAMVLAPNDELASGTEQTRRTVTRLLALPHVSIAWHPIKVEVARSGELAYLIGAYELRFDDARGVPAKDRGKLVEIWKRQADGGWKCAVDTWNSDLPAAPPPQPTGPGPTAPPTPPSPVSAPPAQLRDGEYGAMPIHYEDAVREYFQTYLKDPDSVQYREIAKPEKGYVTTVTGIVLAREKRLYGWTVKAAINARNSNGIYVGFKTYSFLFRGEKIVHTTSPLAEDELR